MKKIKLLVMAVLLASVFSIGAYAQSDEVSNEEFKIGNTILKSMTTSSSDPISYTSDSISNSGSFLSINSKTYSNQTCDSLELSINVQKKVNGSWSTVHTYNFTTSNSTYISKSASYYGFDSGEQYRLKTYHYATVNDSTYVTTKITPEITAQ